MLRDPYDIRTLHYYYDTINNYARTQFEHIILHARARIRVKYFIHTDSIRIQFKSNIIFGPRCSLLYCSRGSIPRIWSDDGRTFEPELSERGRRGRYERERHEVKEERVEEIAVRVPPGALASTPFLVYRAPSDGPTTKVAYRVRVVSKNVTWLRNLFLLNTICLKTRHITPAVKHGVTSIKCT